VFHFFSSRFFFNPIILSAFFMFRCVCVCDVYKRQLTHTYIDRLGEKNVGRSAFAAAERGNCSV
jgi:hypothetical protein